MTAIGVTGFGRCGSTMVMAMLDAGGCSPVVGSSERGYEVDPDRLAQGAFTADELDGHALKLLDSVMHYGLPEAQWKFVWIDRDPDQQALSMYKMFASAFGGGPEMVPVLAQSFRDDRSPTLATYRGHGPVLVLRYERVLADPLKAARALRRLVPSLDVLAAAEAVHKRSPECREGLDFELTGARP